MNRNRIHWIRSFLVGWFCLLLALPASAQNPDVEITKTASTLHVGATGGTVTYTVRVVNKIWPNHYLMESLELESLIDDVDGDLNGQGTCTLPQSIFFVGTDSYECSYTVAVTGLPETSVIGTTTATGHFGTDLSETLGSDFTLVNISTGVQSSHFAIAHTEQAEGSSGLGKIDVLVVLDPGSSGYVYLNTADGTATQGKDYGGLTHYEVSFPGATNKVWVSIPVVGDTESEGDENLTVSGWFSSTGDVLPPLTGYGIVTILDDDQPSATVAYTTDPATLPEPGGSVTYTARVDNPGTGNLSLESLEDDIYLDLNGRGDCALPQTISAGGYYECSYTETVSGGPGTSQTNTVTALGSGSSTLGTAQATVPLVNVPADLRTSLTATPASIGEPGGPISYTVRIDNTTSSGETVTLEALTDSILGDLDGVGTCALGDIPGGDFYECTFSEDFIGAPGASRARTVTARVDDGEGEAEGSDDVTVTITDAPPTLTITKTSMPDTVPETGANVGFVLEVTNTSQEVLTLIGLADSEFGDVGGKCSTPRLLSIGETYQCVYDHFVDGSADHPLVATVTATARDDELNTATADGTSTVTFTDTVPTVALTVTPGVTSLDEPGGDVTYTVRIDNQGTVESVTLDSLLGDLHGDLNGQGDCATGGLIFAGGSYSCSYTGAVSGNADDTPTNTVTANTSDDDSNTIVSNGSASVTLLDALPTATATLSASPSTLPEAGGDVTFTVSIANTSGEALTLESLSDDAIGDIGGTCVYPGSIAAGATYECSYVASVTGSVGADKTVTIYAIASDDEGNDTSPQGSTTITFTDSQPQASAAVVANPVGVDEPGADVTYTVTVSNTATVESLTLDALTSGLHGDLNGQGDCVTGNLIFPGSSYSCTFTAAIACNAGTPSVDTVTATVSDDDGNSPLVPGSVSVACNDVAPTADLIRTASPTTLPEPGGSVDYGITVTNTGIEALTLQSLSDSFDGDLHGVGDCAAPQTIAVGGSYACSYTGSVSGNGGQSVNATLTATLDDDDGNSIQPQAVNAFSITDVLPQPATSYSLSVSTVPETGGTVAVTLQITNAGIEDLTLDSLSNALAGGDLLSSGTCTDSVIITSADPYDCVFTATIGAGDAGDVISLLTSASVSDDDGNSELLAPSADVTLTDVAPSGTVTHVAAPSSVNEPGGLVTFSITVTNTGSETLTLSSLVSAEFGDVGGTCTFPTNIVGGGDYSCQYDGQINGQLGGTTYTNVLHTVLSDDDGNSPLVEAPAQVQILDLQPSFVVSKTPLGPTAPEGQDSPVPYTIQISNTGTEPLTLTALSDDTDDLASCPSVGGTIAVGAAYTCTYTGMISGGDVGDVVSSTVSATVEDDEGNSSTGQGTATVTITDVLPTITVEKTAPANSFQEPSSEVTYTVTVTNSAGVETLTLDALIDDTDGDLNGVGDCSTDSIEILVGTPYSCSYTVTLTGNAGDQVTSTVSATASDNESNSAQAEGSSTLTAQNVQPQFSISGVLISPQPPVESELDLITITWEIDVENTSHEDLTFLSATSNSINIGTQDADCAAGQTLAPGAIATCRYQEQRNGQAGNLLVSWVRVRMEDEEQTNKQEEYFIVDTWQDWVPQSFGLTYNVFPDDFDEPGGQVFHDLRITNPASSREPLRIDSIVDGDGVDVLSLTNCASIPFELDPGISFNCSYTEDIVGSGGTTLTSTLTVGLRDDEGNTVTETRSRDIDILDVLPTISVTLEANPDEIIAPGSGSPTFENVTFTATITNLSDAEALTLDDLQSNPYGSLIGECSETTIAAGGSLVCDFGRLVSGNGGDSLAVSVTATVSDDENNSLTRSGNTTVDFVEVDFGDAPFATGGPSGPHYQTPLIVDGARHRMSSGLRLGTRVDSDLNGFIAGVADGDDNDGVDDEDGVSFGLLTAGATGTIEVTTSASCNVYAWIDYDLSGVFDNDELVIDQVVNGTESIDIAIPATAVTDLTYARFRCTTDTLTGPTGEASDGEVEDYRIAILPELAANLVDHWSMDDGSGCHATNSGTGPDAELVFCTTIPGVQPEWVTGVAGSALYFDGEVDQSRALATTPGGISSNALTVSAWITDENSDSEGMILSRIAASQGYELSVSNNTVVWNVDGEILTDSTTLGSNARHIVAVFDGANLTMTVYVNGNASDSIAITNSNMESSADDSWIGTEPDTVPTPNRHEGMIDDLRVYSSVLTLDQIRGLYHYGLIESLSSGPPLPESILAGGAAESLRGTESGSEGEKASFIASVDSAAELDPSIDLDRGLLAHWTLDRVDSDQSCVVYDSSRAATEKSVAIYAGRRAAHGVIGPDCSENGPTWVRGPIGDALYFDGIDDGIHFTDSERVSDHRQLSLSLWTWQAEEEVGGRAGFRSLIDKRDSEADRFGLYVDELSRPVLRIDDAELVGQTVLADGFWHQITAVWDGTELRLYVDGLLDGSLRAAGIDLSVLGDLRIGASAGSEHAFVGAIDEVRIHGRALGEAEILSLLEAGLLFDEAAEE